MASSSAISTTIVRLRGSNSVLIAMSCRRPPMTSCGATASSTSSVASAASARQLRLVATGHGTHDQIWHTYGIIERYIPGEVPAMHNARQQRGELNFDAINRIHVPIALGTMILALVLLVQAPISGRFDETGRLAATVTVAILANAVVCGVLSGPHDRYGARIAWIATFTAAIAILRAISKLLAPSPKLGTIKNQI